VVATITRDGDDFATEVADRFRRAGLRVELDIGNDKIGYKVRAHSLRKVPVIVAIGKRETEQRTVSLRRLGGRAQEVLALDEAVARLVDDAGSPLDRDVSAETVGANRVVGNM